MKLFTVGPVEMFESTLEIAGGQLPYFRTSEFSEMMLKADEQLKEAIHAFEGAEVIYLTASGTGAMEAAVMNCFNKSDKVLIINGGGFGARFIRICSIYDIPYTEIKVEFDETITPEMLAQYDGLGYTGLLVNIHETSVGKLYPLDVISDFCKKNNLYLMVDAISSIFADPYDMEKYHIDATIFSSHKALALSPGMSVVVLSDRIVKERVLLNKVNSLYFDFKDYINNFKRGQTPYTPAVGVFIEFAHMMDEITKVGIQQKISETNEKAVLFRKEAIDKGFKLPPYEMSNALTLMMFEKGAERIYRELKDHYGYVVTPSGGADSDRFLRIGHMGNLTVQDGTELLNAMEAIKLSGGISGRLVKSCL